MSGVTSREEVVDGEVLVECSYTQLLNDHLSLFLAENTYICLSYNFDLRERLAQIRAEIATIVHSKFPQESFVGIYFFLSVQESEYFDNNPVCKIFRKQNSALGTRNFMIYDIDISEFKRALTGTALANFGQ